MDTITVLDGSCCAVASRVVLSSTLTSEYTSIILATKTHLRLVRVPASSPSVVLSRSYRLLRALGSRLSHHTTGLRGIHIIFIYLWANPRACILSTHSAVHRLCISPNSRKAHRVLVFYFVGLTGDMVWASQASGKSISLWIV